MTDKKNDGMKMGWAQADITPDKPVLLAGQFHARVSEGIMDPVTATALAVESVKDGKTPGQAVMVSCDLATISNELRNAVRARAESDIEDLDPESIFIGATHTHSAPDSRTVPYGMEQCANEYKTRVKSINKNYSAKDDKYGMWPCIGLDVMPPADYLEFAAERIAEAVKKAWDKREPAGIAYGLGHAVVGRNRRLTYEDGTSKMYGNAGVPEFRYVEGYEDHSVYALMTYDADEKLTGIVVNVSCPSQVRENSFHISADYWHETRQELRKRFGPHIYILAQCAPAGDQSPHVLIGSRAEKRMWRLHGNDLRRNRSKETSTPCEEIARRIAEALEYVIPAAEKEIDWNPKFEHKFEMLHLPRRMISEQDVEEALENARPFKEKYEKLVDDIENNPDIRKEPRWYTEVSKCYRKMERGERVKQRFELQKESPDMPIEVHAIRLGDVAFATNPFELYLDYGVRMQELSKATQTFLIQKSGCSGTYLPSERSVAHKGYGSVPASTNIGPEGGQKLVDWTVDTINRMW